MNIFSKAAQTETDPEFWMPAKLRADKRAKQMRADYASSFDPLSDDHDGWREYLAAELPRFITLYLAETKYDGWDPSNSSRGPAWALQHETGGRLLRADFTSGDDSARREEFQAALADIVSEINRSSSRRWAAYITLRAVSDLQYIIQTEAEAAEREAHRLAVQRCPVCGLDDHAVIGRVAQHSGVPGSLRCCEECAAVAIAQHAAEAGRVAVSGRQTRADLVRAALASAELS